MVKCDNIRVQSTKKIYSTAKLVAIINLAKQSCLFLPHQHRVMIKRKKIYLPPSFWSQLTIFPNPFPLVYTRDLTNNRSFNSSLPPKMKPWVQGAVCVESYSGLYKYCGWTVTPTVTFTIMDINLNYWLMCHRALPQCTQCEFCALFGSFTWWFVSGQIGITINVYYTDNRRRKIASLMCIPSKLASEISLPFTVVSLLSQW